MRAVYKSFHICMLLMLVPFGVNGQIFIWGTVDPAFAAQTKDFWENSSGYGRKVPVEMIKRTDEVFIEIRDKFQLALMESIVDREPVGSFNLTNNPLSLQPAAQDLVIDMVCGMKLITDKYPYYRENAVQISPIVYYDVTVFDPAGSIIENHLFEENIDYKKDIRKDLKGLIDYQRDLEIYRISLLQSFRIEIIDSLIKWVGSVQDRIKDQDRQADKQRYDQKLGLIIDKRKNEHPEYYAEMGSSYSSQSNVTYKSQENVQAPETEDASSYIDPALAASLKAFMRQSKNYALIIGVKEYQSPNVNDLANPISDATRLARVLLEKYNFREKEMVFLQNPTRMQIITALDLLAGVVTPIDNLLIFYAGHGLWDEQFKKGYWIPSDASPDNRSNWFSNSALRDYVGGIRSHHTLLITDACFGGGIFRTREAFSDVTQATFELYKLPSRKAMTSGAMTTVPDRSVFIEYLLKRLAENNNPYLSSEQLFASFKIAVINNSATNQVPQFGEIRETGDEGGDFLFILK